MALREELKYFKDDNGYDVKVEKPDIDDNFTKLADAIDGTPFDKSDVEIYPKDNDLGLVIGAETIDLEDSDNGDNKVFYDKDTNALRVGYVKDDRWDGDNRGEFSVGFGKNVIASGKYSQAIGYGTIAKGKNSYAFGYLTEANFDYCLAFGSNVKANAKSASIFGKGVENKQEMSAGYGIRGDNVRTLINRHFNTMDTSDDTQTSFDPDLILSEKGVFYIIIHGVNVQDDYSTKWIFDRSLIVTIDGDKKINIVKDDNVDIVKDDNDWKFDIISTDGDDDNSPKLTMKVTGKADTNIGWGIGIELESINWN